MNTDRHRLKTEKNSETYVMYRMTISLLALFTVGLSSVLIAAEAPRAWNVPPPSPAPAARIPVPATRTKKTRAETKLAPAVKVPSSPTSLPPTVPAPAVPPASRVPDVKHCLVSLIQDVHIPAQERGVLVSITVKEGDLVRAAKVDDRSEQGVLANIDEHQAILQKQAAQTRLDAAKAQADDAIAVQYAQASYKVANTEYEQALEINQRVKGTIPEAEVRRLLLTRDRAILQIRKSQLDKRVAQMNAKVHEAEVHAADDLIRRQRIRSPVDGVVVAVFRHAGEWVNPGEPVLRVVGMNPLRVEGFVEGSKYNPADVAHREVIVVAELAKGRRVAFTGKVVFVSPIVQAGGRYRIRAEVTNRTEQGEWLLRPGMATSMIFKERK